MAAVWPDGVRRQCHRPQRGPDGAVRWRHSLPDVLSPLGLGAAEIARIVAFCTVTFALGVCTLAGISLIANGGEAATLLHSSAGLSRLLGVLLLAAVTGYAAACASRRSPLRWQGWSESLPSPGLAVAQIAVASVDLSLASAALYLLLPPSANVSFLAFEGLYMVALAASVLSAVPGGLGVFESLLVLLLPAVPAPQVLGALLAYRLVYYVLPFVLALLLLSAHELGRQRKRLAMAISWTRKSLDYVVPQAMAMMVFGVGFLLLLSGATPATSARLAALDRMLPLEVLELSHLAGSAVGVLLLILARGLPAARRGVARCHVAARRGRGSVAAQGPRFRGGAAAVRCDAAALVDATAVLPQGLVALGTVVARVAGERDRGHWRLDLGRPARVPPRAVPRTSSGGSSRWTDARRGCCVPACSPCCCSDRSPA